ncbi:hypothetical protein A6A06_34920 [Streptomyces sp. CB02923]|uniref:hypothetical protein n=1 Tax=Streptomyces sp. CB02923 TaxID=1718985 RepID=UPI000939291D|nr:hypothetical protein [Streptomyces sp. CB02923]OKI08051.1 hypothetical protein A6A06_34920 [Streptomyces sp. CB02923]
MASAPSPSGLKGLDGLDGPHPTAAFGLLAVGYVALLNTRRGSAVLGRPVRGGRRAGESAPDGTR